MKDLTYFAIFEPTKTGYSVFFPDLLGLITTGGNIKEALQNSEEALGLHLWAMEKDKEEIPKPTNPPFLDTEIEEGAFIMPIKIYMDLIKNEMNNRSIKKTLTIPYYLNEVAEKRGVNFSQVLQTSLKEILEIN